MKAKCLSFNDVAISDLAEEFCGICVLLLCNVYVHVYIWGYLTLRLHVLI